jgi:chromosome partitioning protein
MRSIAVINQKGGVGKSTISANLGHALALAGKRVTVLDLDPQGHLTASLGIFRNPARGVADLMLAQANPRQLAVRSRDHLSLLPAGQRLGEVETLHEGGANRAHLLRKALAGNLDDQDFVLIDCPPSSGLLVANAVLAVDEALVPVTGDYLGLNGLAQLMQSLKGFQPFRDKPLRHWIVLSRYHPRRRLSGEVRQRLLEHFDGRVLQGSIREAAVLAECPGVGRTIFEYRAGSRSAEEFRQLAGELIDKEARQ